MGTLRFVLALSVVLAHVGVAAPVTGQIAVQVFFVISGFYMALVLDGRYTDKWTFWTNRLLRLFPGYFLIAGLSAMWLWKNYPPYFDAVGWFDGITNIVIVGQDVSVFNGSQSMLLPQAWSLALELYFYALAPWIVKLRTRTLLAIIGASFVARAVSYVYGLDHDPWTYRFFPFEVAFFLIGVLIHRTGLVPPTGSDKMLGELSYPIYINHIFIARMIHDPALVVLASIALAIVMVFAVERPLDRLRTRRRERADRSRQRGLIDGAPSIAQ